MRYFYIILVSILCMQRLHAQQVLLGRVEDQRGTPIAGASVSLPTSQNNTATNSRGYFSIATNQPAVTVSIFTQDFLRLDTMVQASADTILFVLKRSIKDVEEVVISTGYQKIPQERATGSFVVLDEKLLERRVTRNVLDKLEGLAAGLQYDNRTGNARINVRGINTFSTGLSEPLIVVDNFPYEGNINNIDPNDVESVNILRDAAATSIWGAKAGNGVIVITLKKARAGSGRSISATYNRTMGEKPNLFYYPVLSSKDFIDVETYLFDQGFYNNALANRNNRTTVFSPVVTLLDQLRKGQVTSEQVSSATNHYRDQDYRHQMLERFYRPSLEDQFNLSVSQGGDRHSSRLSVGYQKIRASEITNSSDRLNVRWNGDMQLTDKLRVTPTVLATLNSANNSAGFGDYPLNPGGGKSRMYPYAELFDSAGNPLAVPSGFNNAYRDTIGGGRLLDWTLMPANDMHASSIQSDSRHLLLGLDANHHLGGGLSASVLYNYERQNGSMTTHYAQESYYTRNLINRYTRFAGSDIIRAVPLGDIQRYGHSDLTSHKVRAQLNFDRQFGGHHIVALAGGEISDRVSTSQASGVYGYDPERLTNIPVDYVTLFPIFDGLSAATNIPSYDNSAKLVNRFVSAYFNGSYTYNDRYIASLSLRRDASNVFGVNTNERWNPLWSAGASWLMDRESFMQGISWLDNLKLSVTHGYGGNAGGIASMLPVFGYMSRSITWTSDLQRARVISIPNADLRWELVRQSNLSLNFSVLGGAISGSIEHYRKKSTDLISPDLIDPTHGFVTLPRNIGVIRASGIDVTVSGRWKVGRVNFDGQVLFTKNSNTVEQYYGTVNATSVYVTRTGQNLSPIQGESLYPVFAYRFAGLDGQTGDPQGMLDGETSTNYQAMMRADLSELHNYGTGLPPYYGSYRQQISYKDFSFSFNLLYKFGHYFQQETIMYGNLFNSWVSHQDYNTRWQQPGDEAYTSVPSMVYPANAARDQFYAYSEPNIHKGDHIRLQDVQLSYALALKIGARRVGNILRMYVSGNNLGVIWKRADTTMDPDHNFLPPPRRFTIGVNLTL